MKSTRELGYRIDQTGRLMRAEGVAGISARLRERAATKLRPASPLPVDRGDLERVARLVAQGRQLPDSAPVLPGQRLRVAWVCVPPRTGSGGHTTLFRMVQAMADAGHESVVYLQDRHGGSLAQHTAQMRRGWPWLTVELRDLADGIDDGHALFASSWQTAYPILASPALGVRFYFVQDYEPGFYAAGSEALLAEATYGFGFHGITAGAWLAQLLCGRYGMAADHFDFGCDLTSYRVDESPSGHQGRTGVCLYSRPSTPRRAHELATLALELFAQRRPDVEIHLFGERVRGLRFRAEQHGMLAPRQLSDLYNRCVAGVALSATNVSLVPLEMLAAGCIPVVNEAEHNRVVLDNPNVAYVSPAPFEIAAALETLVSRSFDVRVERALAAAGSVGGQSWTDAGDQVEAAVTRVVHERAAHAGAASLSVPAQHAL
jgi:hypothetical protein